MALAPIRRIASSLRIACGSERDDAITMPESKVNKAHDQKVMRKPSGVSGGNSPYHRGLIRGVPVMER
jgi:hypothetical protein